MQRYLDKYFPSALNAPPHYKTFVALRHREWFDWLWLILVPAALTDYLFLPNPTLLLNVSLELHTSSYEMTHLLNMICPLRPRTTGSTLRCCDHDRTPGAAHGNGLSLRQRNLPECCLLWPLLVCTPLSTLCQPIHTLSVYLNRDVYEITRSSLSSP